MFKTAVDIMLFKGFRHQSAEEESRLAAQIEKEIQAKEEELAFAAPEIPPVEVRLKELEIPNASEARKTTVEQIQKNSEKEVRKEASEILEKAMRAIQEAIADEKFAVDLGGPGRPDPGYVILAQAYGNYREDSRTTALEKLRELGYRVEEVDNIFIRITW